MWKPRDPPRGLRLSSQKIIFSLAVGGNQKTRQGDCDTSRNANNLDFLIVETKRPAKGIATIQNNVFANFMLNGNQKTRQGDCDFINFKFKFKIFLWKPKDPPRGLRLSALCPTTKAIAPWKPKDPPRGLRLKSLDEIPSASLYCGNQKTRQGDCDEEKTMLF